jgi:hypothetical protein
MKARGPRVWVLNLVVSAVFSVCGGVAAYFGWLGRRGQPARSYDFDESILLTLVSFVLFFLLLSFSNRRKS